jgi:polyhydroxyalkanoate synthesis regulator protein
LRDTIDQDFAVNDEVEPRMIKKYPNRRLYDTEQVR